MGKRVVDDASLKAVAGKIKSYMNNPTDLVFPEGFKSGIDTVQQESFFQGVDVGSGMSYAQGYDAGWDEGWDNGYLYGSEDGFNDGKQAEYDHLWDGLQQNGKRTAYACAFGGWKDELFKPKYDIKPTDGYMMFRSTNISDLRNVGVALDFSKCTNFQYMFQWATTKYIGEIDIRLAANNSSTANMFGYAQQLISIDKMILKDDGTQKLDSSMFNNTTALQSVMFEGIIPLTLSFGHCKKLIRASIVNIVSCLSTTATGQTITFSKTAINKAFETSEGANDGMESEEFNNLMSSRENWTFAFST